MKKLILPILLLLTAFAAFSCRGREMTDYAVIRLSDGTAISFSEMIGELRGIDFIFVGELHDDMTSHELQLQVIKALHTGEIPLTVGFEMFQAGSQPELDRWLAGDMGTEEFARLYYRNWGLPWPYYRDIFLYLQKEKIPMLGLNIPPTISQKVAARGVASLNEEELAELPPGLSCDVSPRYREYIRQVFSAHAGDEGESFQNFCEAQVLWDKTMAWHLVQNRKGQRASTVVLCGMIHALKQGIPIQVREMEENATIRVIVPQTPGIDIRMLNSNLADYLVLAD